MDARRERRAVAMTAPPQRQTVLWIIAVLLAIIATALVMQSSDRLGLRSAYGDPPVAGSRGVFAFTGQLNRNTYGLFMVDVDSNNIWCYQYVSGTRKLKLVAARSFLYDRYLEDYDNDEPTPLQVKAMLADQRRIKNRISRGGISSDNLDHSLESNTPAVTTNPTETKKDQAEDPNE